MLASHYAPAASVLVMESLGGAIAALHPPAGSETAEGGAPTVGLLTLAEAPTPDGWVRLAEPADADAYAHVLYAALREADALGLTTVVAVPPPDAGVGTAVRDRLRRAATPPDPTAG
jgi:L-threonylcarbamoyladenylate synthase